jgi:hypothetical protein
VVVVYEAGEGYTGVTTGVITGEYTGVITGVEYTMGENEEWW